jgi:hypothetical protein
MEQRQVWWPPLVLTTTKVGGNAAVRRAHPTGPVVVHGASPTRTADVGRQRPRAGGRCCVASSSTPRSVSDQCGVTIAHRHPVPLLDAWIRPSIVSGSAVGDLV